MNNGASIIHYSYFIIQNMNSNLIKNLSLAILLGLALSLIYFVNWKIIEASYYHYWGINYYLNGLTDKSYNYWQKALNIPSPYIDSVRQDWTSAIQQGYQAGAGYQPIEKVHVEGLNEIKKIIQNQPLNFFFYGYAAEYYNVFSKFDKSYLAEAEKMEQKAWELSPNRQQILYTMAKTALLINDDKERAYGLFKKAVDLNPDSGDAHFYFGLMAWDLGDKDLAIRELKIARKAGRMPKNSQEAILVGDVVADYAGDLDWAIEIYNNTLNSSQSDPLAKKNNPDIRLKLALAYFFKNDFEMARQEFTKLSEGVNLKTTAIYPELKPILLKLGLEI